MEMQRSSLQAETNAVNQAVWGAQPNVHTPPSGEQESDEMGHNVGDDNRVYNYPAPVIIPTPPPYFPQPSGGLNGVKSALLGAALVGLPIAGYFANQFDKPAQPPAIVQPESPDYEDSTIEIGLGDIDDYE